MGVNPSLNLCFRVVVGEVGSTDSQCVQLIFRIIVSVVAFCAPSGLTASIKLRVIHYHHISSRITVVTLLEEIHTLL